MTKLCKVLKKKTVLICFAASTINNISKPWLSKFENIRSFCDVRIKSLKKKVRVGKKEVRAIGW